MTAVESAILTPPSGGRISLSIPFTNPSATEPLELQLVQRSCRCTDFEVLPPIVEPGGEGLLTLSTHAHGNQSGSRLSALFKTGIAEPREIRFTATFRSYPSIEFQPADIPLQRVRFGESGVAAFSVVVNRAVGGVIIPEDISLTSRFSTIEIGKRHELAGDDVHSEIIPCKVIARIPRESKWTESHAPVADAVTVTVGEDAATMKIYWQPESAVSVIPRSIVANTRQKAVEKSVNIRSETEFTILSFSVDSSDIDVDVNLETPDTSHQLTVRVNDLQTMAKAHKRTIELETDHPEVRHVHVPVYIY